MLKQAKTKAHIIYTDERLNSKKVVYFNIYQNFLLCAMKMHTYIRSWGPHTSANHSFIQAMIKQVIRYCFVAVSKTGSSKLAKLHGGRVTVQEQDIIWLGTHAFHTIFSRTPQCHSFSIKRLVSELALLKHWRRARKFRELVKDGKDSLAHVVY
ncbi:Telomerase reverse transcriptase [Stygiomarasmius scandens]|uniref:Telomerase reverse transcriptase n=1 Tax=Marasmiellus scandens TaxID=2682957 RepID=A0ABR1JL12_9AGAR